MKIQNGLGEELDAVLELLLQNAGLQSSDLPFPVGKRFICVPSPSLWPRSDSYELTTLYSC